MVMDGSITNNPVFKTAGTQLGNRDATQDGIYRALAEHVPAVSSPVGGRMVFTVPGRDVNMNLDSAGQGVPRPNGWGRNDGVYLDKWFHSDMKDMAFFYVYPLFDDLATKGTLK